jgi:excisionase family DNA binding protein
MGERTQKMAQQVEDKERHFSGDVLDAFAPRTMPVAEALRRYGIGRTKLYALISVGALKAVKLGTRTLIDVSTADAFFDALPRLGRAHEDARR